MTHCDKYGATKLVKKYKLPVTGFNEVDYIVTEYCLMKRDREINKFVLLRISDEITLDELKSVVEFDYDVSPDLQPMVK